jgi:hypothetical protein
LSRSSHHLRKPVATSGSLDERSRIERSTSAAISNAGHHTIRGYFSRCPNNITPPPAISFQKPGVPQLLIAGVLSLVGSIFVLQKVRTMDERTIEEEEEKRRKIQSDGEHGSSGCLERPRHSTGKGFCFAAPRPCADNTVLDLVNGIVLLAIFGKLA